MNTARQRLVITASRQDQLIDELRYAIESIPRSELTAWGSRLPTIMLTVTRRRGTNLKELTMWVGSFVRGESTNWFQAYNRGEGWQHFVTRGNVAKTTSASALYSARNLIKKYSSDLSRSPEKEAPKLIALILGFLAGSGGIDGDGGVPDLDLLGGIGAHRSIFTHSIISGIVFETIILGVADLARTVHGHLPAAHDPLWDKLAVESESVIPSLIQGLSAGIAYHLGVDSTIDGAGVYRDLPVSAHQDIHQTITGVNAVAEGVDAAKRNSAWREEPRAEYYSTFAEAQAKARANPGSRITRISNGTGFTVTPKRT